MSCRGRVGRRTGPSNDARPEDATGDMNGINITTRVDADVARTARMLAAQRGTSLSHLLAQQPEPPFRGSQLVVRQRRRNHDELASVDLVAASILRQVRDLPVAAGAAPVAAGHPMDAPPSRRASTPARGVNTAGRPTRKRRTGCATICRDPLPRREPGLRASA